MKIDWETLLAVLTVLFFVLFAVIVFITVVAHAETCMTVDVLPSQVLSNYDGDTFTVSLGVLGSSIIRVEGVDTPERNKKQPGWKEAKDFTSAWLAQGPFKLNTCFVLTLGRLVASPSRNGETLAAALIAAGHVKPR